MKDLEGGKPSKEQYVQERRKLEGEIGETRIAKIFFYHDISRNNLISSPVI